MSEIVYSNRLFNPLFWHIMAALRDPAIRYIYLEGGSSASKTYTACQALLYDMQLHGYSSAVFRRYHIDVKDYIYASFKMVREGLHMQDFYECQQDLFKSKDGKSNIVFKGLDDEDRVKGLEAVNVVYMNEFNQFEVAQWDQMRKRLRGRHNQKFVLDWNPVSDQLWLYKEWLDLDEWQDVSLSMPGMPYSTLNAEYAFKRVNKSGNSVWIKTTYRDNFWIVGHPSGRGGRLDEHVLADFEHDRIHKPHLYRVYANGERGVMRTGGEFFKAFNAGVHTAPVTVGSGILHISCDQNVTPYVTLSVWQLQGATRRRITQVHELPCKTPDNNAPKSARLLDKWLRSIGYTDALFIYGDPSGNNRSVVDPNNSSFFDKFIEELRLLGWSVHSKVAKAHPEVALSADFINDIYEHEHEGYSICIGSHCGVSIHDYSVVQQDKEGGMIKTKIKDKTTGGTYEPHGHFSDAKRYLVTRLLDAEFRAYKVRGRNSVMIAISR